MNLPKQTAEIFQLLSKGNFISSNGSHSRLYDILQEETTFVVLREYFAQINFHLESGHNYYYFSQEDESNQVIEKKLEQFSHYIDILDFFSSLDTKPSVGTRYRTSQIAEECYSNERLKQKISGISRKEKLTEKINDVAEQLVSGSFFEREDEDTYKVLDAIQYLEQIITLITLDEDGESKTAQ